MIPPDINWVISHGISSINLVLLLWLFKKVDKIEKKTSFTEGYLKGVHEASKRMHTPIGE